MWPMWMPPVMPPMLMPPTYGIGLPWLMGCGGVSSHLLGHTLGASYGAWMGSSAGAGLGALLGYGFSGQRGIGMGAILGSVAGQVPVNRIFRSIPLQNTNKKDA